MSEFCTSCILVSVLNLESTTCLVWGQTLDRELNSNVRLMDYFHILLIIYQSDQAPVAELCPSVYK